MWAIRAEPGFVGQVPGDAGIPIGRHGDLRRGRITPDRTLTTSRPLDSILGQIGLWTFCILAWDAAPVSLGLTFSDDPLVPRTTTAKVVQLPELRSDIDTVRARLGLEPVSWTDPTLIAHVAPIKRMHVIDFRPALDAAYQKAGKPLPAYTDATIVVAQNVVKANHLNDVRGVFRTLFTPTITGPLHAGSRTVSGTGIPGSSVQLFVNGVAR